MKQFNLLFLTIASFLFFLTSCERKEEIAFIESNLPEYLFKIDVRNAAGTEMHELIDELGFYAEKQEKEYKQSMRGIEGLYLSTLISLLGSSPDEFLDDYKARTNDIILGNMFKACDMAYEEIISAGKHISCSSFPNDTLFNKVLGSPFSEPSLSDNEIDVLLKDKIICNMPVISKKTVEKCEYQKKDHLWEVTMNDGLIVHVRVENNDDGTKDYIPILPNDYVHDLM